MNPNLEALKDIHSPSAISWFPPAMGWYGLAFLLLLALVFVGKFLVRRFKQYEVQKNLREEFLKIKNQLLNPSERQKGICDFSAFLRRMALKDFPRENVANLQGDEWLLCLDNIMQCEVFSKGKGRVLLTAPYEKNFSEDVSELFPWVERWIKSVKSNGGH